MNEILKILGTLFFIVFFRYLSWMKLIALGIFFNGIQYCYQNKKSLKKFIEKQNRNLTLKKSFVIILIGIPLVLIDIFNRIQYLLNIIWQLFIKTSVGRGINNQLEAGDKFIKNKKSEMKSKAIQYVIQKSMPGMGNNMPDLGKMEGLNDLFKNPEEMSKMMESIGKMMGNLNMENLQNSESTSMTEITHNKNNSKNNISKPMIEEDLFARINKYMEDENTSINASSEKRNSKEELNSFERNIMQSKLINRKIRRRIKKKRKNNVTNKEFNDMKKLTAALQEVVKDLDVD
ncbi:hypothetical protein CPAV1605_709 [seawater metagenome]|uniref:Uncharacterized protein n=1 Tax=seawater metagenome TaxID=1561972 RepID=A0A5E8CK04_9ZZZZ